jgi:NAD(P)-dependent dehydrogenase (short-subunit alcohol dehydrogenase family)
MSDPRFIYPKPPFDVETQEFPGEEHRLNPRPLYGRGTYKGSNKLKGKVALITGGDSGIGRAVAYTFASEGANVVISYFNEATDAAETVEAVEETGQQAYAIPGDIQSEDHCRFLVSETVKRYGKLDILVNNAAYQMAYQNLEDITKEELDRNFYTNVYALIFLVKAAWEKLKPGSSIINTTSVQAYDPSSIIMPYAATKAAINNLTKTLASKAIDKGIRVNAVAPGPIWTPLNPMAMPKEYVNNFGSQTKMKRPGQPIEVAPIFVFLASDEASYITGHTYAVTGGETLPV